MILVHVLHMKKEHHELANVLFYFDMILPSDTKWTMFRCPLSDKVIEFIVTEQKNGCFVIRDKQKEFLSCGENKNKNVQILDDIIYRLCISVLFTKSVLHLHSSFVLYNDQAILFTGPSGIGKTTQAELWRDYEDAVIVNGDVTLIRKIDDVWRAFGAPIHGSSPYCENMDAPIAAIIVLKQAEENQLIRLDAFTALAECFPEIYRPEMSDETREILLDTVDALFSEIPVYQLSCRPDRESVELVKQTLFDQNPEL